MQHIKKHGGKFLALYTEVKILISWLLYQYLY